MILTKPCFPEMIKSPVRIVGARVELFEGSELLSIYRYTDRLKEFTVQRIGDEGKFFGFGVCQKANIKLLDPKRELNITTANTIEIEFGVGCEYLYPYPSFRVTEVHRDENTNLLSITAYDELHKAAEITVSELNLLDGYTIRQFLAECSNVLNLPLNIESENPAFETYYNNGANFDGTETLREALNAVAEATQTVYFINSKWELTFRGLSVGAQAVFTISKGDYISLDSKTNRRLATICHATELGDNVSASTTESGTTQYIRNNPFWEMREDIGDLVVNALDAVGGLTINQFSCEWRGNFALEVGDKIELETKDGNTVTAFVFNDSIYYNGFLSEKTSWQYKDTGETASNPASLGEALKNTFARVDKQKQQIDLVAKAASDNGEAISSLQVTTGAISASVEDVKKNLAEGIQGVNNNIDTVRQGIESKITAAQASITAFREEIEKDGTSKVTNTVGRFDENGLTIAKSDSEMETTISEDGMVVKKNTDDVLTANHEGVKAVDLHANTYLKIGAGDGRSRFEDYSYNRTGCFWIGG